MITFAELLNSYIETANIKTADVLRKLEAKEVKVSKTALYQYIHGETLPKFSRALSIVEALDIETSSEELAGILNYSENYTNDESTKQNMLFTSIKVNYRKFIDTVNAKETFEQRVNETSSGITEYITKLIHKDLQEGILKEGEDYGVK